MAGRDGRRLASRITGFAADIFRHPGATGRLAGALDLVASRGVHAPAGACRTVALHGCVVSVRIALRNECTHDHGRAVQRCGARSRRSASAVAGSSAHHVWVGYASQAVGAVRAVSRVLAEASRTPLARTGSLRGRAVWVDRTFGEQVRHGRGRQRECKEEGAGDHGWWWDGRSLVGSFVG